MTTPLLYALRKIDDDNMLKNVFRILLEHGADTEIKTCSGTILHHACVADREKIVDYIINTCPNVDIEARDNYGYTPLIFAVDSCNVEMVKILIEAGANLDASDTSGRTALIHSVEYDFGCDVVEVLLEAGADTELKNKYGETALMVATMGCGPKIIQKLLDFGADVNACDNNGWTALFHASMFTCKEVVKQLLEAGAEINAKNICGKTPLIVVTEGGFDDVAKCLLENGADPDIRDNNGKCALDYKRRKRQ